MEIRGGGLGQWVTGLAGAGGLTYFNDIFLSRLAESAYQNRSRAAVELIGHELTHVLQYRKWGFQFFAGYLGEYAHRRAKGEGHQQAYLNLVFEQFARNIQTIIATFLKENEDIANKIEEGTPLSEEDLELIRLALAEAQERGTLKTGYQIIHGVLVYVEPLPE